MACFLTPLRLEYVDGSCWRVHETFSYAIGTTTGSTVVAIDEGFTTDFASIPRVLWPLLPPTGWYGKAAVIHDKLYQDGRIGSKVITRKYADDVLNEAMCVLSASWILEHGRTIEGYPQLPKGELRALLERKAVYWGVRLGGWVAWNNYRKKDGA